MRLFLDSSVILAACGSRTGGSSAIFASVGPRNWTLLGNDYVFAEVETNVSDLGPQAVTRWAELRQSIVRGVTIATIDRIAVFHAGKDRPILFSALASADVLLTLDVADLIRPLGGEFFGLSIETPRMFLERTGRTTHLR